MSGSVVLFAPGPKREDDPLVCTRWIADRTQERLSELDVTTRPVFDDAVTRAGLESSIEGDIDGVAFFSHGRVGDFASMADDAIIGADGPALDRDNASLMAGKWGHAIACHAGHELAARACEQGAECFVGYEGTLGVEWLPENIPGDVEAVFVELVTKTTCNLATGIREPRLLRRDVARLADALTTWCAEHPERAEGLYLEVTAAQLVERLVYRGPAPAP